MAEEIIAHTKGRLYFKLTPYMAGSVIPRTAESAAEPATDFIALSLTLRHAPKAAPPCAKLAVKALTNKVDVILNSNSYVHSLIKYKDGNYRYDYGKPDMRVPIKYAIFEGLLPFKTYYCSDISTIKNTSAMTLNL